MSAARKKAALPVTRRWDPCGRVAIIGDVGGHLDVFSSIMSELGADVRSGSIPEGLRVIQVGDLVHKGPDSEGCVALADRFLAAAPGQYVQLMGNHEAHYLGGPDVSARAGVRIISLQAQQTLQRWWSSGAMHAAHSVSSREMGPVLITHGGLTSGAWKQLGTPQTAAAAAAGLNALRVIEPARLFRPGALMTQVTDLAAGILCPRTGSELAVSWLREPHVPFAQVHGHEGVWHWPSGAFHDDVPEDVRAVSAVDGQKRWCSVRAGGKQILSIDWVLGQQLPALFKPEPLLLDVFNGCDEPDLPIGRESLATA